MENCQFSVRYNKERRKHNTLYINNYKTNPMIVKYIPKISAIILAAFTLITLFLTSSIFFNLFGVGERVGNYVLYVVIANFICSLLNIAAVYGFWREQIWTTYLLVFSSVILFFVLIAFLIYIYNGGVHEQKTLGALVFRIVFTGLFTALSYKFLNSTKK